MEEKEDTGDTSLSATEYLTRSSAKQSDGHRQMVNFLEKLSRDENGTPVDWSFVKSKRVKGKTKKITSFKKNVGYAPWLKKVLSAQKSRKEDPESRKKPRNPILKKKRKMSEKPNMTNPNELEQPTDIVKKKRGRPKKQIDPEISSPYPQSHNIYSASVETAREITDELCIKGPMGHIILSAKQEMLLPADHKLIPDEASSFDNFPKPKKQKLRRLWKNGKTSQAAKRYVMKKKLLSLACSETTIGDNKQVQMPYPPQKKRSGRPPKHISKAIPTVGTTGLSAVEIVRRNKKLKKFNIKQNLIEDKKTVKSLKPKLACSENVENINFLTEGTYFDAGSGTEKKFELSNMTLGTVALTEKDPSPHATGAHTLPCDFTKVGKKNKEHVMNKKKVLGNKAKATQSLPKLKKFEWEQIFETSIIQQVFSSTKHSHKIKVKRPCASRDNSLKKQKRKPGRPRKSVSNEITNEDMVKKVVSEQPNYEDTINKVVSEQPNYEDTINKVVSEQPNYEDTINKVASEQPNYEDTINKVASEQPNYEDTINKVASEQPNYEDTINKVASGSETLIMGIINPVETVWKKKTGRPPKIRSLSSEKVPSNKRPEYCHQIPNSDHEYSKKPLFKKNPGKLTKNLSTIKSSSFVDRCGLMDDSGSCEMPSRSKDQMPVLSLSEVFYINDGKRKPGRPPKRKSLPILHREPSLDRSESMSVASSFDLNDTVLDSSKVGVFKLPRRLSVSSDRSAASSKTVDSLSDGINKYDSIINKVVEDSRKFVSDKKTILGKEGKIKKISKKMGISSLGPNHTSLEKKKNGLDKKAFRKLKSHQESLQKSELKLVQRTKIAKQPKQMFQYKKSLERAKAFTTILHTDGVAERKSIFSSVNVSKHKKSHKKGPLKLLRSQMMVTRKGKEIKHLSGKKRKRTLSGEFDLLDEFTLRKQVRRNAIPGDPVYTDEEQDNLLTKDISQYRAVLKSKPKTKSKIKLQTTPAYISDVRKVEPHSLYAERSILANGNNMAILEKKSFHIPVKRMPNRDRGKGRGRRGFFRLPRRLGCSIRCIHERVFQNTQNTSLEFGEQNATLGLLLNISSDQLAATTMEGKSEANEAALMPEEQNAPSNQREIEVDRYKRGRDLRGRIYHMIIQKGRIKQAVSKRDMLHENVQSQNSVKDGSGADRLCIFDIPSAVKSNILVETNVAQRRKRGRPSKRFGHQRFLHDQNNTASVICSNSAKSIRGNYMHRGRLKFLSSRALHQNDNHIDVDSEIESEIVGQNSNFAKRVDGRGRVKKIRKKILKKQVLHEDLMMQSLSDICVFEQEKSVVKLQSNKATYQQSEAAFIHNADDLKISDVNPGGVPKSRKKRGLVLKNCTVIRRPNEPCDKYRCPQKARRGCPRKRSQLFSKSTSLKTEICESSAVSVFESDVKNILENIIDKVVETDDQVHTCKDKEKEDSTKFVHSDVGDDGTRLDLSAVLPVDGKSEVKLEPTSAMALVDIDHSYFAVYINEKSKLAQQCTSLVTDPERGKIVTGLTENEKCEFADGVSKIPCLGTVKGMQGQSLNKESNQSPQSFQNSVVAGNVYSNTFDQQNRDSSQHEVQSERNETGLNVNSRSECEPLAGKKDEVSSISLEHFISDHKDMSQLVAEISSINDRKGKGKLNETSETSANEMGNVSGCLEANWKEIQEKNAEEQNKTKNTAAVPDTQCLSNFSDNFEEVCSQSAAEVVLHGKQPLAVQGVDNIVTIAVPESTNSTASSSPQLEMAFIKEGKTHTEKRVFELRQKVSRSPLQIIAMRQTLEEEKYFMEKFQKSQQKASKLERLKEQKSLHVPGDGIKKGNKTIQSGEKEVKINNIAEMTRQCLPCSVGLTDFVKQIKLLALQTRIDDEQDEGSIQDDSSGVSYEMELAEESTSSGSPLGDIEDENVQQKTEDRVITDSPRKLLPPLKLKLKLDISKSRKHHRRKRRGQRMVYQVASTTTDDTIAAAITEKRTEIDSEKKNITDAEPAAVGEHETCMKKIESTESKDFEGSFLQFIKEKDLPQKPLTENKMVSQTKANICENKLDNLDQTGMPSVSGTQEKVDDMSLQEKSLEHEDLPLDMLTEKDVASQQKSSPKAKQFHCKACNIVTESKTEIESHVYKHLSNIPFRCGHCHRVFPSRGMAFLHSRSSHSDKETKIEKVGTVKESDHYTVMEEKPEASSGEAVIHANLGQLQKSSEPVIISVVLPQNVHESVGRYSCSFCKFSSSSKDSILEHVNTVHKQETTYTCSVCNKTIFRYQESVADHFERNHPQHQVTYKCSPDFYDVQQSSQDKGNIFDRMNCLFDGNKGNLPVEAGMHRSFSEKTSAEADSTTKEPDVDEINDDGYIVVPLQQDLLRPSMSPVTRLDRATSPGSNFTSVPSSSSLQTNVVIQIDDALSDVSPGGVVDKSDELKSSHVSNAPDTRPSVILLDDNKDKETESDGANMELKIMDVVSLKEPIKASPLVIPSISKPNPAKHVESTLKEILSYQMNSPPKSGSLERVGTTYKCDTCNIHVPVLQVMLEHLKKHHNMQSKLFQCPYCKQMSADLESDVIKHIQTSHPLHDSTVVSLSSSAKEHLKLLVIPVGHANKDGSRFLIEKDIYQCLKCQKHMPSLDFIYDHLEKEHNEVFVYVCPYCKKFKGKEENVVFDHIRVDHNKSTSDIMLSLAIEENLFIRVPSLTRDKAYHRLLQKSVSGTNTRKQMTPRSLTRLQSESGLTRTHSKPTENNSDDDIILISDGHPSPLTQAKSPPERRIPLPYQPRASGPLQNRTMQLAYATATTRYPPPAHQVQNVRSGISFHRPTIIRSQNSGLQAKSNVSQTPVLEMDCECVDTDAYPLLGERAMVLPVDHTVKEMKTSKPLEEQVSRIQGGPPPLVRGPPPLIRYDHVDKLQGLAVGTGSGQTHIQKSNISTLTSGSHNSAALEEDYAAPPVRNMSFSMTDKLHRLHSSVTSASSASQQQTPPPSDVASASTARPVLKIPSIPPSLRCRTYQQHPADVKPIQVASYSGAQRMQDAIHKQKSVSSPLDLSKHLTSCGGQAPNSNAQQVSSTSQNRIPEDIDDMPPDAFKIFNLAPQPYMPNRPPPYPGLQSPLQELQRQVRAGFHQDIRRQVGVDHMSYNRPPVPIGRSSLFPTSVQTSMRMPSPSVLQQRRAVTTVGQRPMNQANIPMNFTSMHMFKCPYCPSIVPLGMGDVAPHIEKFHPGSSIVFVSIDR